VVPGQFVGGHWSGDLFDGRADTISNGFQEADIHPVKFGGAHADHGPQLILGHIREE
jgi:hypothetical protein